MSYRTVCKMIFIIFIIMIIFRILDNMNVFELIFNKLLNGFTQTVDTHISNTVEW